MASASSRNELDGGSIKRVTLYDGGGNPASSSSPIPVAPTVTALTGMSPAVFIVGAVSTQAVASNGIRRGLTLTNLSASQANISLGLGVPAVLGSGITLVPNGSFSMDEFSLGTSIINAIATASGANLAIQQWVSS